MTEPTPAEAPVVDGDGVITYTPEQAAEAEQPTGEADDDAPADMRTVKKLRHEAAGLRVRLKEAEARAVPDEAYESALARLAALERREVEREAAEVLIDPGDLYRYTDAEAQQAFIDSQFGEIARDPIIEAAKQIARERPHLAKPNTAAPPTDRPVEGLRPGASPEPHKTEVTWSSALRRSI